MSMNTFTVKLQVFLTAVCLQKLCNANQSLAQFSYAIIFTIVGSQRTVSLKSTMLSSLYFSRGLIFASKSVFQNIFKYTTIRHIFEIGQIHLSYCEDIHSHSRVLYKQAYNQVQRSISESITQSNRGFDRSSFSIRTVHYARQLSHYKLPQPTALHTVITLFTRSRHTRQCYNLLSTLR